MKYLFTFLLFLFISFSINAQNVMDLCKSYVESLGGMDNISKIENISIEQTIYSNNREVPQSTFIVPEKVYYQEINFQPGRIVICVVDGMGWTINTYVSSKATDLSEREVDTHIINSNVFGPLYDYYVNGEESKIKEILLEGEKIIDRENCYKLNVVYKSGFIVNVYISTKSFMIKKTESSLGSTTYSDYKKVNKVMFPFRIEIVNRMGVAIGEVINLKTNIKMDYDKFNKP